MKRIVFCVLVCFWIIQTNIYADKYALVIGNGAYREITTLRNPVNDAMAMTDALKQSGFSVMTKTNVTQQGMEDALWEFGQQLTQDDVALFYYSGHGIQVEGINFLLPVDIQIKAPRDVKYKAMYVDRVLETLEHAGSRLNIVILDACRDNPFRNVRSLQGGLAAIATPKGTLVAYATAPGKVAYDGNEGNSPYTKHLLTAMRIPGLKIEEVFKKVRELVISDMEKHQREQVPWEESALIGDFYFIPQSTSQPSQSAQYNVTALLQACEQHFQANRLTNGRGGTALECYEQVLQYEPTNSIALDGLKRIEEQYVEWAQKALQQGKKDKAQQYLASLREVNPESPSLFLLEEQVSSSFSTSTLMPEISTPTPIHKPSVTPLIQLRSEPQPVAYKDAPDVFGLHIVRKGGSIYWRPRNDIDNQYELQGEIIIDHVTGLMWQQAGSKDRIAFKDIPAYIQQLNQERFAGYSNWRVPTIPELLSLFELEEQSDRLYINSIFDRVQRWCWSADEVIDSPGVTWSVLFDNGVVYWDFRHSSHNSVRAVRSW